MINFTFAFVEPRTVLLQGTHIANKMLELWSTTKEGFYKAGQFTVNPNGKFEIEIAFIGSDKTKLIEIRETTAPFDSSSIMLDLANQRKYVPISTGSTGVDSALPINFDPNYKPPVYMSDAQLAEIQHEKERQANSILLKDATLQQLNYEIQRRSQNRDITVV